MLGLVCDIGPEVSAHNTMPGRIVLLIELFLNVCGNVFLNVEFLQGYVGAVDGILLHLLVHVSMLDHGFSLGCCHNSKNISN